MLDFCVIDLMGGVGIVPSMVVLFAISQIIRDVTEPSIKVRPNFNIRGTGVRWSEFAGNIRNMLRSTAIGVGIGILPGIGGSASNLVSYGAARQAAARPEEFGPGALAGVSP